MLERMPSAQELESLIGSCRFKIWTDLCAKIDSMYDMERLWNSGGRTWDYEYKYRRGGKTLCALYARDGCFGFMIIFGKDERERFEAGRRDYSAETARIYDEATVYHDGKWVMFMLEDHFMLDDLIRLLAIKRKPNRK
jgi:hypothetical protein